MPHGGVFVVRLLNNLHERNGVADEIAWEGSPWASDCGGMGGGAAKEGALIPVGSLSRFVVALVVFLIHQLRYVRPGIATCQRETKRFVHVAVSCIQPVIANRRKVS